MSEQAQTYADTFERYCNEIIALAKGLTDEQWVQITPEEGWPVGTIIHHVALAMQTNVRWLQKISSGQPVTMTMATIDGYNAQHATQVYDKQEAIELLHANSAVLCDAISALDTDQLAASAPFAPGESDAFTTEQLIRAVIIRHVRTHLTSLRVTLGLKAHDHV